MEACNNVNEEDNCLLFGSKKKRKEKRKNQRKDKVKEKYNIELKVEQEFVE